MGAPSSGVKMKFSAARTRSQRMQTSVPRAKPLRSALLLLPSLSRCVHAHIPVQVQASTAHANTWHPAPPCPHHWGQPELGPPLLLLNSGAPSSPPCPYTQINDCPFSAQHLEVSWPKGTVTTHSGHLCSATTISRKGNAGSWVFNPGSPWVR